MKQLLKFVSIGTVLFFAACSTKTSSDDSGSGNTIAVTPGQCLAGQIRTSDNRCLERGQCGSYGNNYGWDGSQCVSGTYVDGTGYSDIRFEFSLSVTDRNVFGNMIKDYTGGCGTYWLIGGPDYAALASPSYLDIHTDHVDSDRVEIFIGLGSSAPDSYTPPKGVMRFSGSVYDINVNQPNPGLTIQANGTLGGCNWNAVGNNGLEITAASQTFRNDYMDVILKYRQQPFARARLYSY